MMLPEWDILLKLGGQNGETGSDGRELVLLFF